MRRRRCGSELSLRRSLRSFGLVVCVALAGCQLAVEFDRSLLSDAGADGGTGGVNGTGGVGGSAATDGGSGSGGGAGGMAGGSGG